MVDRRRDHGNQCPVTGVCAQFPIPRASVDEPVAKVEIKSEIAISGHQWSDVKIQCQFRESSPNLPGARSKLGATFDADFSHLTGSFG